MNFQLRITGPGVSRTYAIQPGAVTIGRKRRPSDPVDSPDANIILDTPQVARRHAKLDCTTNAVWITDLGSEFGTRLNGRLLEPWTLTQLQPRDTLVIGLDYTLVLEDLSVTAQPGSQVKRDRTIYVPEPPAPDQVFYDGEVPPGLSRYSLRLLQYLPEVYQPNGNGYAHGVNGFDYDNPGNFMARFLAIFESIMLPIEWTVVNFDLFLCAMTAPEDFLPWLEQWFLISTDASWSEEQRRTLLAEADELFTYRGTAKSLRRVLEIYTGVAPDINDEDPALPQHTFRVTVYKSEQYPAVDEQVVTALIDMFKPAHTTYVKGVASHARP
jgi:phage tail-like protein